MGFRLIILKGGYFILNLYLSYLDYEFPSAFKNIVFPGLFKEQVRNQMMEGKEIEDALCLVLYDIALDKTLPTRRGKDITLDQQGDKIEATLASVNDFGRIFLKGGYHE